MTLKNIQSNDTGVSLEAVAFMVAFCRCKLTKDDVKTIGSIFDVLMSPSASVIRKREDLREILNLVQSCIRFDQSEVTVSVSQCDRVTLLEPNENTDSSANISPNEIANWGVVVHKLNLN